MDSLPASAGQTLRTVSYERQAIRHVLAIVSGGRTSRTAGTARTGW
jgi:hypothetical protein